MIFMYLLLAKIIVVTKVHMDFLILIYLFMLLHGMGVHLHHMVNLRDYKEKLEIKVIVVTRDKRVIKDRKDRKA